MSDPVNIRIGNGKAIHTASKDWDEERQQYYFFTICGTDHMTNMGRRPAHETESEITCKKCKKILRGS